MTRPKSETLGSRGPGAFAYWNLDEVPEHCHPDIRAALSTTNIDRDQFIAWLSTPLERYRIRRNMHADKPQVSEVVAWMLRTAKSFEMETENGAALKSMPELADQAAFHAAHRDGVDWSGAKKQQDSGSIAKYLRAGAMVLSSAQPSVGNPGKEARDEFFVQVRDRLATATTQDEADRIAREIFVACGVPLPPSPESLERSERRRRKARQ